MTPGPCVRCGLRDRTADTYLCTACRRDPRTHVEIARAQGMANDYPGQRAVLIAHSHWAGGWIKRLDG